jgi:hypothetical protein
MHHPYDLYLGKVMKRSFTDLDAFMPMISDDLSAITRELRIGFAAGPIPSFKCYTIMLKQQSCTQMTLAAREEISRGQAQGLKQAAVGLPDLPQQNIGTFPVMRVEHHYAV